MQRVEKAYLHLGVGGEGGDDLVEAIAGGVVQQNAHAHAAVGGFEQFVHEHACADAVVHDVVLQVEAGLGVADQLGARHEGLTAVGQQAKARAPLVGGGLGLDRATERRLRGRQSLAWLAHGFNVGAADQRQRKYQSQ